MVNSHEKKAQKKAERAAKKAQYKPKALDYRLGSIYFGNKIKMKPISLLGFFGLIGIFSLIIFTLTG